MRRCLPRLDRDRRDVWVALKPPGRLRQAVIVDEAQPNMNRIRLLEKRFDTI